MNPDADTQDLAGIYQLEAAVFVQNADYTFAMMSAASGCDQVALVNLDNPAIGKLERERFERRALSSRTGSVWMRLRELIRSSGTTRMAASKLC